MPVRECAQCESLWAIRERTPRPTQAVAEARQRIQTTACAVNPSPRCHRPAWFTQVSSTASIKWPPCKAPPGTGEQGNSSLSKAVKRLRLQEAQHRLPPDAQGNSSVYCQGGGGLVVSACVCLCAHEYVCMWVQGAPCLRSFQSTAMSPVCSADLATHFLSETDGDHPVQTRNICISTSPPAYTPH